MSRDRIHDMEQFRREGETTPSKTETSFVYDILSEGHLQATAHRFRSHSMHTSRLSIQDNSTRNKKYRHRRMSLPPNGTRVHRERTKAALERHHGHAKGHEMEDLEHAEINRSARFFKERSDDNGDHFRRVRSFKTTSKGLVNRGDSFEVRKEEGYDEKEISKKHFDYTLQTCVIPKLITSKCSIDQSHFRVLITGARDVGKSSLIDQFMTSDFLGSRSLNVSQSEGERTVTLQVDGEESTLEFVQSEDFQDQDESFQIDGFVVVYCITERATFDIAIDLLKQIREEVGSNKAIILVGNKSDLVRKRTISQEEGRSAADAYGCKYIELSAALNHRVDELLVGIHKQIKLKSEADNDEPESQIPKAKERKSSFKRTKRFLEKVFLGHSGKDKKTENLYVE